MSNSSVHFVWSVFMVSPHQESGEKPSPLPSRLDQPFTPSGLAVGHQVGLAVVCIGGMRANIQQIKRPSQRQRRFLTALLAPCFELTVRGVILNVALLMSRGDFLAAFASQGFVVMPVDGGLRVYGLIAEIAGHIAMPPIRKPRSHLKCEQVGCSQAFL